MTYFGGRRAVGVAGGNSGIVRPTTQVHLNSIERQIRRRTLA